MLVLTVTALVVLSDGARAVVEEAFASGAAVVADHWLACLAALAVAATLCLLTTSVGGPSGDHVYAVHPDTKHVPDSALSTAAGVAAAAREVARRVRRRQRQGRSPQPRWHLFRYGNVASWAMFLASSYYLLTQWRSASALRGGDSMSAVRALLSAARSGGGDEGWRPLAAVAALSLSLGYLLVFSSVSFLYKDVLRFVGKERDEVSGDGAADVGGRSGRSSSGSCGSSAEADGDGDGDGDADAGGAAAAATTDAAGSAGADGAEVIIVGCGVAGASLAVQLGKQGRRVLVIERNMEEADRIVGELLQPGGLNTLRRIGLEHCATEGIDSVEVHGYNVIRCRGAAAQTAGGGDDGEQPHLPLAYPREVPRSRAQLFGCVRRGVASGAASSSSSDRPMGRSFHNARFVQRLRGEALRTPNVTVQVGAVTGLITDDACTDKGKGESDSRPLVLGVTWRDLDTREVHEARAPLTVVCDGIGSGLRKHVTGAKKTVVSHFVGLILHHEPMATPLPMPFHGHVLLADPAPVLLYQISSTETRVLVDVPVGQKPRGAELQAYLRDRITPQFPAALRPPMLAAIESQTPKAMSNGSLHAERPMLRGAVLLGDAWNIRHPLTGAGMTVALRDGEMLAAATAGGRLHDGEEMEARLALFRRGRAGHAATINILANALHRVFSAPEADASGKRARLREACYRYLSKGGFRTAGPVGLLAGLTAHPWVLTTHFFMVALYATRDAFLPFPTPTRLLQAYDLIHVACLIIMPMLAAERVTLLGTAPLLFASNVIFPWRSRDIAAELN